MSKLIFLFSLLLFSSLGFAQHISSSALSPEYPASNDSVSVSVSTYFVSQPCIFDYSTIVRTGNTVYCEIHYTVGILASPITCTDTLLLGEFSPGNYEVICSTANKNYPEYADYDTLYLNVNATGVASFSNHRTTIQYLPILDGIQVKNFATRNSQPKVEVINPMGEIVMTTILSQPETFIPSHQFASGLYTVRILDDDKLLAIQRFVK